MQCRLIQLFSTTKKEVPAVAEEHDELNMRRRKREELRQKQRREQRRLRITLIAATVVLLGCAAGIFFIARSSQTKSVQTGAPLQTTAPATRPNQTEATQATTSRQRNTQTVIHIKAAGDLNITNKVVESGLAATGYDYTQAFMDVAPVLADADLTVLNFEGNICGEPYGTERASAPREILQGLRSAGVDLVQTANSYSIFNGLIGMTSTLRAVEEAGLQGVGAFASDADYRKSGGYTIVEVQGVKVAFVAFTKGLGGMGMPSGSDNLVNLLYEDYDSTYRTIAKDAITKTLDRVNAQKPDIVVALLHWGSEYNDVISDSQKNIVSLLQKNGVDVILGTHPHLVQQVEYDPLTGKFVAYSLGDFFGDAVRGGSNYSIIVDLEITKDTDTGSTRVTDWSYTPIYTLTETECDGYRRVVRIREAMAAYEGNFVDKVTKECYDAMTKALTRITERLKGE